MGLIKSYNALKKGIITKPITPKAYSLQKRDLDYQKGHTLRYFCQKSTDISSPIFEISSTGFTTMKSNPYFSVAQLKWRISGPIDPVLGSDGKTISDMGVLHSNRNSIQLTENEIPALRLYLVNLTQYHK